MRTMRRKAGYVAAAVMIVAMCAGRRPVAVIAAGTGQTAMPGGAHQSGGTAPASVGGTTPLGAPASLDNMSAPFPDTGRQKRNDERQRRIVSDTQRLLALTEQLKAEVASTGAESMSPEMLKQMEEIEKLAKSVKDKMRD